MPGNFWAAKCQYVKQLILPTQYWLDKKRFYANNRTVMQKQGKISAKFFAGRGMDIVFNMGNQRFALEQW